MSDELVEVYEDDSGEGGFRVNDEERVLIEQLRTGKISPADAQKRLAASGGDGMTGKIDPDKPLTARQTAEYIQHLERQREKKQSEQSKAKEAQRAITAAIHQVVDDSDFAKVIGPKSSRRNRLVSDVFDRLRSRKDVAEMDDQAFEKAIAEETAAVLDEERGYLEQGKTLKPKEKKEEQPMPGPAERVGERAEPGQPPRSEARPSAPPASNKITHDNMRFGLNVGDWPESDAQILDDTSSAAQRFLKSRAGSSG